MGNELFRFTVGHFTCSAIRDGDDWDRNVLLVDTGRHKVLIDTGNGDVTSPPGLLLERLRTAGVSPAEVDVVILSHADIDHLAGTMDANGNLVFPHARYVLAQAEWAFWASNVPRFPPRARAGLEAVLGQEYAQLAEQLPRTRLPQLRVKLELTASETEIVLGVRAIAAPGHTPGHTVISVTSADEELRFVGDLAYDPNDIGNPDWHTIVDVDPIQAVVTRDRLFDRAAREGTLLMAYHFPFPGLGYIAPHGAGWRWRSYEISEQSSAG